MLRHTKFVTPSDWAINVTGPTIESGSAASRNQAQSEMVGRLAGT